MFEFDSLDDLRAFFDMKQKSFNRDRRPLYPGELIQHVSKFAYIGSSHILAVVRPLSDI
jgi:hypothetical protein